MAEEQLPLVEVDRLRVGLFVHLGLHWTEHPFQFSSFLIRSQAQIEMLRSLGISAVRYSPARSECEPLPAAAGVEAPPEQTAPSDLSPRQILAEQQASLERSERQYAEASRALRSIMQTVQSRPEQARQEAEDQVGGLVAEVTGEEGVAIRLLSEKAGQEGTLHSLNVLVLSVLLARAMQMTPMQVREVGMGAILHDIGKVELPDRVRWLDEGASAAEKRIHREHVMHGLTLGKRMGLPAAVLEIIHQHHENADGSGYPQGLKNDAIHPAARIVSLVNRYDNLCNPANPMQAMTPHDALAWMFAKERSAMDVAALAGFIRMMGVYPPGSVLQLSDGRFAMSVSVNPDRPLRPRVLVHDPAVPVDEALLLDLADVPDLGIQRSVKPLQLPRAVFDYLSPRKRMCYFFERSRSMPTGED